MADASPVEGMQNTIVEGQNIDVEFIPKIRFGEACCRYSMRVGCLGLQAAGFRQNHLVKIECSRC